MIGRRLGHAPAREFSGSVNAFGRACIRRWRDAQIERQAPRLTGQLW